MRSTRRLGDRLDVGAAVAATEANGGAAAKGFGGDPDEPCRQVAEGAPHGTTVELTATSGKAGDFRGRKRSVAGHVCLLG